MRLGSLSPPPPIKIPSRRRIGPTPSHKCTDYTHTGVPQILAPSLATAIVDDAGQSCMYHCTKYASRPAYHAAPEIRPSTAVSVVDLRSAKSAPCLPLNRIVTIIAYLACSPLVYSRPGGHSLFVFVQLSNIATCANNRIFLSLHTDFPVSLYWNHLDYEAIRTVCAVYLATAADGIRSQQAVVNFRIMTFWWSKEQNQCKCELHW